MSKHYGLILLLSSFMLVSVGTTNLFAQSLCDATTPKFIADLTGKPDSIWLTPFATRRQGTCCSPTTGCVEFVVTLDTDAYALNLEIASGAFPTGTLTYKIDCEEYERNVGEPACLMGGRTYNITFCKPGNNINTYRITSYGPPTAVAAVNASVNTPGTLTSSGFNPANLRWRSVSPGSPGQYDSYLSNPTAPETQVIIPASENVPSQIVYEVTGNPYIAQCRFMLFRAQSTVSIITHNQVSIAATNTELCPERPTTTLMANSSGGSGRYEYIWSTGETSQTITAGAGTYWVRLTDLDNTANPVSDTLVLVTPMLVSVNAGTDKLLCSSTTAPIQLLGEVTNATSTLWSTTGSGTFSGDLGSLHNTYTPSNSDKTAGRVSLVLRASRLDCSPVYDTLRILFEAPVLVDAGPDREVCSLEEYITLTGSSSSEEAIWTVLDGGSGRFESSSAALTKRYYFSMADKQLRSLRFALSAPGVCLSADTAIVFIRRNTKLTTGSNLQICNNSYAQFIMLSGSNPYQEHIEWHVLDGGTGRFEADTESPHILYYLSEADKQKDSLRFIITPSSYYCSASDTLVAYMIPELYVNAGPDRTICTDQEMVALSASGSGDAVFNWVSGTGGTFYPNAQAPDAEYILSPLDKQNKQIILVLQAISNFNGACGQVKDTLIISIDVCTTTSVQVPKETQIQLYPNPSNGEFYLHVPGAAFARFQLTDLTGKQVFFKELNTSEPAHLQLPPSLKGVFLVRIQTGSSTYHKKLLIQ